MTVFRLTLALAMVALCPAIVNARADPLAGCREIISEWEQIEQADYSQTGSYRAKLNVILAGRKKNAEFTVSTRPGHKLIEAHGEDGTEGVYGRSPKYGFAIRRSDKNQPWLLVSFVPDGQSPELQKMEQALLGGQGLAVLYPLGVIDSNTKGSEYLARYVRQLKEAHYDKDAHRLVFTLDSGFHGTAQTDPALGNVITSFNATVDPGPSPVRVSYSREFIAGGRRPDSVLPLCKSVAGSSINDKDGGKKLLDFQVSFSDYSFDPPPDDVFLLSHYGLPEPAGSTVSKPIPNYVWVLVAAAVCGIVALSFRYLARRTASPAPK